ncbi:alpha/beta hydrolase fold domain-containing protein [Rhizosaccharibacter radicis]|uniref:Alpha/beta hydrolase fold domain-containing protein n=1 Tax=Rhizosaccharibacter radicis TaxID=2782605 RepID=A0ABT1W0G1_9PROT|nr:alpha/beta hydrolase fold domain-containing protein [Acetobacteraceae bacterium KSS12]
MPDPSSVVLPPPAPLRPEMERFRDDIAAAYHRHPPLARLSLPQARAVAEQVRAPWAAGGPVMLRSHTLTVPLAGRPLRLRLHQPARDPDGLLAYVHGGGWQLFSVDTHDRVMREYAARSGLAVVGIDYSLSPEARFPRAVEEVTALLRWLRTPDAAGALELDTSSRKLAVGGDSAGGNLSLAATLALRDDEPAAMPDAVVMNYPVVDPDTSRPSYRRYGGPEFNLTEAEMRGFWNGYAPEPAQRHHPRASLLRGSLRGLPPVLIALAECDVLHDEGAALAEALALAGVPVRALTYRGMPHSFLEAMSISPDSARAFDDAAAWLRDVLRLPVAA